MEGGAIGSMRVIGDLPKGVVLAAEIFPEDWPYQDVHPDQLLYKYMDLPYFQILLERQALYFRRADKFKDSLEGELSPEGVHGTSRSSRSMSAAFNIQERDYEEEAAYRKIAKACTFVDCWHINYRLNRLMWNEYTSSSHSIAIVTTRRRLEEAIAARVNMSAVKYVPLDSARTEFAGDSLFLFKDDKYSYEQEFRVITDILRLGEESISPDREEDHFRSIPVKLELLIEGICVHPEAGPRTNEALKNLVGQYAPFLSPRS